MDAPRQAQSVEQDSSLVMDQEVSKANTTDDGLATTRERPILFSAEMVRAILDGRKTQTRRVFKYQNEAESYQPLRVGRYHPTIVRRGEEEPGVETFGAYSSDGEFALPCPYGAPGDRLWVRETWSAPDACECPETCHVPGHVYYDADQSGYENARFNRRRPSIHMPRWASRITLEVTAVRVERVQDISDDDCDAEGFGGAFPHRPSCHHEMVTQHADELCGCHNYNLREIFAERWDRLNAKRGYGWDVNPWVFAITFTPLPQAPQ